MRYPASSSRSAETFVHWKQDPTSRTGGRSVDDEALKSRAAVAQSKTSNQRSSEAACPTSSSKHVHQFVDSHRNSNDSKGRRQEQSSLPVRDGERHGQTSTRREQVMRKADGTSRNASTDAAAAPIPRRRLPTSTESSIPALPRTAIWKPAVHRDLVNSCNTVTVQKKMLQQDVGVPRPEKCTLQNPGSISLYSRSRTGATPGNVGRSETPACTEEDGEDSENEEELYGQEPSPVRDVQPQSLPDDDVFYDDEGDDNVMADSLQEGDAGDGLDDASNEGVVYAVDVVDSTVNDETAKRRERRQAQAAREREGNRRRTEGLRRNFLLVDEYTKKPYSVGVGEWRKELMLLSRELDPAIGNINRQPPGAVAEIAEWIQHTWEYSEPIKFEFVKEVVARGVTLRRAELWKKIRNNEPKPEEITDRTWRMLERQLESPAMVRKSESCSRANAARMNFGRTGPSGEVGVRERLRRKLRRSPEPEEMRMEMARDKGYGGRSKKSSQFRNIMHGSAGDGRLCRQVARIDEQNASAYQGTTAHDSDVGQDNQVNQGRNPEVQHSRGSPEQVIGVHVNSMSIEEISEHPLVMKMMQRLEALEGRQSLGLLSNDNTAAEKVTSEDAEEENERCRQQISSHKSQADGETVESEKATAPRRRGRPKKKVQRIQ